MSPFAFAFFVAAVASPNADRVLVADVKGENVDAASLAVIRDAVTTALAGEGIEVVSFAEARNLADVDASKAAVGCDTASASCQAELAQALGARFIVFGSAAKLDDITVVHLALTDATRAVVVARSEVQSSSRSDLVARVHTGALELTHHLDRGVPVATIVVGSVAALALVGSIGAALVGVVDNASINDLSLAPSKRKDAEGARNIAYVVAASAGFVAIASGITAWVVE